MQLEFDQDFGSLVGSDIHDTRPAAAAADGFFRVKELEITESLAPKPSLWYPDAAQKREPLE